MKVWESRQWTQAKKGASERGSAYEHQEEIRRIEQRASPLNLSKPKTITAAMFQKAEY